MLPSSHTLPRQQARHTIPPLFTAIRSCAAYIRNHRDLGVIDSLDARVDVLPGVRRVRPADDFVLAGLVGQPVAASEVHREDARFKASQLQRTSICAPPVAGLAGLQGVASPPLYEH